MVVDAVKKLSRVLTFKKAFDFFTNPIKGEAKQLNTCLREVGEKRQKALAKFERDKHLGTRFTVFEEFDKYLDDRFYQKKLYECYDKYTKVKRAMGQS